MGGNIFGRLTVLGEHHIDRHWHKYWLCRCECGKEIVTREDSLKSGHTKSCGCLHKDIVSDVGKSMVGEKHGSWKGGTTTRCGYRLVLSKGHPRADMWGYVYEHILVAENILGEYIPKNHAIHHINGIKDDNRPENLMWFKSNTEHLKYHRGVK